ncbi:helix-turn-helix domain-containing protein [Kineothrix sp. MB12-C1]|uniref:helix-turn-helix domain-containing protein n=1 Tax=Kineothrix sp. MB12-C1 TaxID=3070215 RepID=UPI0027D20044|nr:helix-turn-helix domain-containing protein [Kineothrix sp. MB12-C1]WMC93196.1 helix-turn-helix domain-containing protein [Kineothrix sp. MB12-C1]
MINDIARVSWISDPCFNIDFGGITIKTEVIEKRALLDIKEFCEYLGIGQTKARELLGNPINGFTIRIGNRLYAHKGRLDTWLLHQIM